jgi:hypothetical protein
MFARTLAVSALFAASVTLGACSSDNVLGLGVVGGNNGNNGDTLNTARVRIANATATSLDIASSGVVYAGNGGIAFGMSSNCTPTNALAPDLSVRVAGTLAPVPGLAASYQSGVNYTVIAYPGGLGATQFATVADVFTPVAGQSALRVFNAGAITTSYDVYVTNPGEPLATATPQFSAVTGGTFTNFGNANAGAQRQIRITRTGSTTVLLDLGSTALIAGQSVTLVISPPLVGSTTLRAFFVTGCNV